MVAGDWWLPCYPPHSHPRCSLPLVTAHRPSSHTASVGHLSPPAASWHPQSPDVLARDSQQSPSSSSGEALGIPPPLPSRALFTSASPSPGGPHCPPWFSNCECLGRAMGGPLWGLYNHCCFCLCWIILVLSLLSFLSFISILIVPSSLLWQARAGKCKFPDFWQSFQLEKWEKKLRKCSQALMAVTVQGYLSPVFRPALCTGLSEQQQLLAVGVLATH